MKKSLVLVLGLLLMCITSGAFAIQYCDDNVCDPCCDPCCDIHAIVYGDYLYWKACRTDLDYSGNNTGTLYVNPGFDSGWRVGGRVQRCAWDLGVRYTSYDSTKENHEGPPAFQPAALFSYEIDFDVVDIEVGYNLHLDCNQAHLRPFVGAKLAWIDEIFIRKDTDTDTDKAFFKGYGLYAGLEGNFLLHQAQVCNNCIPISLVGRGSVAILDSTSHQENIFLAGSTETTSLRTEQCIFISVLEVFAGIDIGGTTCYCVTPHFLVGYEAQIWGNKRFDDADELVWIGLGGLVVRLSLEY